MMTAHGRSETATQGETQGCSISLANRGAEIAAKASAVRVFATRLGDPDGAGGTTPLCDPRPVVSGQQDTGQHMRAAGLLLAVCRIVAHISASPFT